MKVTFYFRKPNKLNQSIERVFQTVETGLNSKGIDTAKDYARSYGHWLISMLLNVLKIGIKSHMTKGVHHITGDIHYCALMMPKTRTILTIHDLVILHDNNISPLYKKFVRLFWYYLPLKRLSKITCISEATRQDIVTQFPFAANKLFVVPNPVSPSFFTISPKTHLSEVPVILHLGTRQNKNLLRVIEAVKGLKVKLRIIGKLNDLILEQLHQYSINFTSAAGLNDKEILEEYQNCDIVSFPSTFEGFGMPIIEAQAASRVVLTSNLEPMITIGGEGAVFVDPYSVSSIRQGFISILSDESLRNKLVNNGQINAKRYSVEQISGKYTEIYVK